MTVALLSGSERLVLLGAAAVFLVVALGLRWRKLPGLWVVGTVSAAAVAVMLLAIERLVQLIIALNAPAGVDYNDYSWVLLLPWGRVGLALGVGVGVVVVAISAIASSRVKSPWRRVGLIGLRTLATCCVLVVFLEPAVELRQVAREPNRIAVLVDDSLSMTLATSPDAPNRRDVAEQVISDSEATFDAWRDNHVVDFYTFSETLTATSRAALTGKSATGRATLIRHALDQLRTRYEGEDLAGVVLVSDGAGTGDFAGGATDGASRDFLRSLGTRVHTLNPDRTGLRDVAVAEVLADEFGFVRTVMTVSVKIRSTGYGKQRIPVTLSAQGKPLRRKWVELDDKSSEATISFEFTPLKTGRYVYEISIPVQDDEAVPTNNARAFVLRVIRDKIRVLQVAGRPSWDVRALRGMLKQNPNVDLISFFILRTQDDIVDNNKREMSLIPFPTRELFQKELPSFDVIVLQNFEFAPYGIAPYLENIRSYVEGGGGLVMLGGDLSFASGRYGGTPVARALPVRLPSGRQPQASLVDTGRFRPQLTALGKIHPITALRYEAADNTERWATLPELEGVNLVRGARKSASVLAVHPTLRTQGGSAMPIVVAGDYGDGRSLAITTDSLWRWGFVAAAKPGDDGRSYTKLWENSIRWLTRDPDLRYLHVDSDRVEYEPGEPVRLDVRILDRDYTALANASVRLVVAEGADPATARSVTEVKLTSSEAGETSHILPGLDPGVYRVTARAQIGGRSVDATEIFLVRAATSELDRPEANAAMLDTIAAVTGGVSLGEARRIPAVLPFAEPRIVRIDRRQEVELWSGPWLLLLALAFLGLEWGLRRRSGYL